MSINCIKNMTNIEKLISIAQHQIGYHEKKTDSDLDSMTGNSGSGNYTKYGRDLDAVDWFEGCGKKQGQPWCATFACWCFYQLSKSVMIGRSMLYQPQTNNCAAVCTYMMQYFSKNGEFYLEPKRGDLVFFGSTSSSNHVGIVTDVTSTGFKTIEGNSSDRVASNIYDFDKSNYIGFGRPNWELLGEESDDATTNGSEHSDVNISDLVDVRVRVLRSGDTGSDVGVMQAILNQLGFYPEGSIKRNGKADGEFGTGTEKAVKKFQESRSLEVNGVCDNETWTKLLGGG